MSTNNINIKYMEFNAFKMDGLGNDFVIIDQRVKAINLSKENISSNLFVKFSNIF